MSDVVRPLVRLATTEADFASVGRLRQELYQEYLSLDTATLAHTDDRLDSIGHVFVAEESGCLIASLRVIPFSSGQSELQELGAPLDAVEIDAGTVEVGRAVARPTLEGRSAGMALFTGAAAWALDQTPYTRLVCYTRRTLVPHFRRFGLQAAGPEFTLPSRTPEPYRLMSGRVCDVIPSSAVPTSH